VSKRVRLSQWELGQWDWLLFVGTGSRLVDRPLLSTSAPESHSSSTSTPSTMGVCTPSDFYDLPYQCARQLYGGVVLAIVLFILAVSAVPSPPILTKAFANISPVFQPFLTLSEAESLDEQARDSRTAASSDSSPLKPVKPSIPLWRTLCFAFVGMVQSVCWIAVGSYALYSGDADTVFATFPFVMALGWLYTVLRPIVRPPATPPYDLFTLYCVFMCLVIAQVGGVFYDHGVFGIALPTTPTLLVMGANTASVLALLGIVLAMPMSLPSEFVNPDEIVRCPVATRLFLS